VNSSKIAMNASGGRVRASATDFAVDPTGLTRIAAPFSRLP